MSKANFVGKTVWVTGGETPLGNHIAKMFLAEGARVLVSGVKNLSESYSSEVESGKNNAICYEHNPINEELANEALALVDSLDVTVIANRYIKHSTLLDGSIELFDDVIEQNLVHAWCATRATAGKIGKKKGGAILYISSIHGEKPSKVAPLYSLACGGINMMVAETAQDFGRLGIRVNQLRCGAITGDIELFKTDDIGLYSGYLNKKVPRGTLGTLDEVGMAAVFLCSDGASFINGATLSVDGGLHGFNGYMDAEARWDFGFGGGV